MARLSGQRGVRPALPACAGLGDAGGAWNARAIALTFAEVGITVDCLPMLDVRQPGATDIIGDRALGGEPMQVAALGRACSKGWPRPVSSAIVKHMPGHGRALVDSHEELPLVTATAEELEVDLEPFERLPSAPMGMTGHIVYTAWDAERPASQSPIVIEQIIRTAIGFDGFLMSDDIGMKALHGRHRRTRGRPASPRDAMSRSTARAGLTSWPRSSRRCPR